MYSKVILVGNLSKDVELRYTQGGQAICKCGIATNKKYKAQDGSMQSKAMFIDFRAFGRSAEVINQYCKKGDRVLIEGELDLEQWTDQNGQSRQKHAVLVQSFQMLTNKQEQTQEQVNPRPQDYAPQAQGVENVPSQNDAGDRTPQNNIPTIEIAEDEIPF